jgi:nitroreductase
MDFFECVEKRYSYRGVFKNIQVPRKDLEKIIKAGIAAPSGCNRQTTSFIGIDDPQLLNSITGIINKNGFKGGCAAAGICVLTQKIPGYTQAAEGGVVQSNSLRTPTEGRPADVYFNVQDYSAAIENMLLAITGLGYASCWIEGQVTGSADVQEKIAKLLNIPKGYSVVAFLPVGIPETEGRRPAYKAFGQRAWFNVFGS